MREKVYWWSKHRLESWKKSGPFRQFHTGYIRWTVPESHQGINIPIWQCTKHTATKIGAGNICHLSRESTKLIAISRLIDDVLWSFVSSSFLPPVICCLVLMASWICRKSIIALIKQEHIRYSGYRSCKINGSCDETVRSRSERFRGIGEPIGSSFWKH